MLGMVALFSIPIYLQAVLGVDAMGTGLRLVPMIGCIVVGIVVSVAVSSRFGYRASVVFGLVVTAVSAALGTRAAAAEAVQRDHVGHDGS